MKTKSFLVLYLACLVSVVPTSSTAKDAQHGNEDSTGGTLAKWWSPLNPEPPKEETPEPNKEQPEPSAAGETEFNFLNQLKTVWPAYTLDHVDPSKYVPGPKTALNDLSNLAAKAREEAKQRARREICELFKACIKSALWFW